MMVFPIMPQSRNNFQPRVNHFTSNRLPAHINSPTNTNGIQKIFKNFSNPNSSIGTLATKGLGNISKTLSNVDQVIKVVQSATPIVQEYGPMIKNLPAMYRMVKAFSQIEDDNGEKKPDHQIEISGNKSVVQEDIVKQEDEDYFRGESTPRMYI